MRVLVTGHKGRLGSRVAAQLLDAGHLVTGYDVRENAHDNVIFHDHITAAAAGHDVIIHAAGLPHPNKGDMVHYVNINVLGTLNVLEAARINKVKRVVFTSSTGWYGCDMAGQLTPAYLPLDERHPTAMTEGYSDGGALDAYNQSKVMAEALLAWYGTKQIVETIVLRIAPANTKAEQYGGGAAWDGYKVKDWRRGALFCNCHPDYAADAIVKAALADGPFWYEVFNVIDLYTHAKIDAQEFAKEALGLRVTSKRRSLISPEKAQTVLGWEPCEDHT
jgi:nucleoside-diphosphate-sugar epimerase